MPNIPRITGNEAIRAFGKVGFHDDRTKGSHHILSKDGWRNKLSIPVHGSKTLGLGLLNSQIKAAGLTTEQFVKLLD